MIGHYSKWVNLFSLAAYTAAVFMIAEGYFWAGIILIGAETALAAGVHSVIGKSIPGGKTEK